MTLYSLMMIARFMPIVLLSDDHILIRYMNVCMMIVLGHVICVQVNGNKITFILILYMNLFDICMHYEMITKISLYNICYLK